MPSLATLKLVMWGVIAFAFMACLAALRIEQAQNGKLKAQIHACAEARKADSDARNSQKVETRERIKTVEKTIRSADDKARVVEKALLPGECRTPRAILDADI